MWLTFDRFKPTALSTLDAPARTHEGDPSEHQRTRAALPVGFIGACPATAKTVT